MECFVNIIAVYLYKRVRRTPHYSKERSYCMKSTKKLLFPLLLASLVLGVVLAGLRIILMDNYYDTSERLYKSGTDLPQVFFIVLVLAFFLTGACAFFIKPNKFNKKLPKVNLSIVFSSSFCGFLFISSCILQLYYFLSSVRQSGIAIFTVSYYCMILFGLLSSLYFFRISSTSHLKRLSLKFTSIFPVLWGIFYLLFLYFDKSVVINNPEREIVQFGVIAAMFYFISEARYQLGISIPRLYFAVSLASIIIICVSCIPNIILTVQGIVSFTPHTIYSFVQLGILSYIVTRILSFTFTPHIRYAD